MRVQVRPVGGLAVTLANLAQFDIQTNIDRHTNSAYPDAMTICAEGEIKADDTRGYVAQRLTLIRAALPASTAVLRIRTDDMPEDADTNVVCIMSSIPKGKLYSEYLIVWKGFLPYFTGVTEPTNIYQPE